MTKNECMLSYMEIIGVDMFPAHIDKGFKKLQILLPENNRQKNPYSVNIHNFLYILKI